MDRLSILRQSPAYDIVATSVYGKRAHHRVQFSRPKKPILPGAQSNLIWITPLIKPAPYGRRLWWSCPCTTPTNRPSASIDNTYMLIFA